MKAGWTLGVGARLNKLRVMPGSEVLGRLRYGATVAIEREVHRARRLEHPDRLRRALATRPDADDWAARLLASRLASRSRFFPGASDQPTMRHLFATAYAGERQSTLSRAADARGHRFHFFGRTFDFGDSIPWQSDPVTGRAWPTRYHADVAINGSDAGGDVKYVWELNRQQFVLDLAKGWFLAGNPQDLAALRGIVRSWIAGNPYATGVNWSCALEPAYRVFSWLWAYHLTIVDLDDQFHLEWLTAFFDHGRFIERHLEHYSSPYNHLVAEAAALYMLGACFPEFRDAARWRARGRHVLESRLAEQFYRDGGSVEQSTYYHHATLGSYLLAGLTARAVGEDLSADVWAAIERATEFSMRLCQPDGTTPTIGGADDGKPIRMEHGALWDFRSFQAIGAVLFERPDFKAVAGRFFEDALWLLGPAALARFDALESRHPSEISSALRASGYFVMRSEWSAQADYVCVDCGEQAAGLRTDGIPNAMHGHADCLSIIVWLNGQRVLVDSGLYAYNCGGEWESHFRETAAHNTARIDGRDQARHLGKMAWSHSYRAFLEGWKNDDRQSWVLGHHDGYARGPAGIVHRRAVWLRADRYLVVYDEFVGTGRHQVDVNYQFAPGELKPTTPGEALFDNAVDIAWIGSGNWQAEIAHGGARPQDGWIAPSLGVRQAAPRMRLTCQSTQPLVSLVTVLAARTTPETRVTRVAASESNNLLAVSGSGSVDWIVAGPTRGAGPIETDATLAICRVSGEACVGKDHIGGTRVDVDAQTLARLSPEGWRSVGTAR